MKRILISRNCSLQAKNGHKANVTGHDLKKSVFKSYFYGKCTFSRPPVPEWLKEFRCSRRKTR